MKTLIFCLLMFSYVETSNRTTNYLKPGGVSVLTVNPNASSIGWRAEKTTGKHNGTIKIRSGSLTFYCQQLAKGSIIIDMNSIVVSDLDMPDKQKLENNLKGDNFFDAGNYPTAKLDISSVDHRSEVAYHFVTVTGNLTLHGITKKVVFTANVSKIADNKFSAWADIMLNRRYFDIATKNFKYDTFINTAIHLHVSLQASKMNEQVTSL